MKLGVGWSGNHKNTKKNDNRKKGVTFSTTSTQISPSGVI